MESDPETTDILRGQYSTAINISVDDKIPTEKYKRFTQEILNNHVGDYLPKYYNNRDSTGKTILVTALESREVTEETLETLLRRGAHLDTINKSWYSWEPLHYAAKTTNPSKLGWIAKKLGPAGINTLTSLSENALHVLLNQGQTGAFTLSCQNGPMFKLSRILAPEHEAIAECAQILLDQNIDINHPNFWNETPIIIALKRKYFSVVKLLLARPDVDLDLHTESLSGKTARELLKGKEFGVLPRHSVPESPEKSLFRLLKAGDEDAFLKYRGGNIAEFVNASDGVNRASSSCTLLQYCFRRGYLAWLQEKKKYPYELNFSQDITAHHMVHVFCQNSLAKPIQHLLENGADINITLRKFPTPVLEVAIRKGYYPFVALILGQSCQFPAQIICHSITKLLEAKLDDCDFDNTLSLLLNKLLLNKKCLTEHEVQILKMNLASKTKIISRENLLLFLKFPGALTTQIRPSKKPILEEVDPEIIETHLNSCVEQQQDVVRVNYESFLVTKDSTEICLKTFLNSTILNPYLSHLVLKILINRKWDKLRYSNMKYFNLNLGFYIFFYVILNTYIIARFNRLNDWVMTLLFALNVLCMFIFMVKELGQVWANPRTYLKELSNYAEIVFIVVTLLVYFTDTVWLDVVMVLSVLSSNLVLLLLLEQVPKFARYIIILHTVVFYLRYVIFYFIQFVAFAICFYILFSAPEQVVWKDLPNKIFETVIIFTGSFETLNTNNFQNKEFFSKVVYIVFVLFMAIILNNLLLGLLVTDMGDINKSIKTIEQVKRASYVVRLESFLPFISKFGHKISILFSEDMTHLEICAQDREMLSETERQYLDFILTKKERNQNDLLRLYSYIKMQINAIATDILQQDIHKEMYQKLVFMEERLRNLHELTDIIKTDLAKK